jgi:choline dehydrogenase-like flavoprotein
VGKPSVLIIGSGAGGSVAAWALATAGHPVVILEKGRNLFPGLGGPGPIGSLFGNDDVKAQRWFENQDPNLEPRSFRSQQDAANGVKRSFVGDVNDLPTTVGGGTVHWDAKCPRFWRQDFKGLSLYGPVPGANVADWPLTYDELAPYYDEVEARLGVQGDIDQIPAFVKQQAPRSRQFVMPPNPLMYAGKLLQEGAARLGYTAYPVAMAINSTAYDGRPRCNSCGYCSGYGCPINARGGAAVSFLHHALHAGAELRSRCFVYRVDLAAPNRAAGVSYLDAAGRQQVERADIVILAASAMETPRLLLMSANGDHPNGLGNRSGQLGRNLMFHFFTLGFGIFPEDVHGTRGPSTTVTIDDFVGPETPQAAAAAGLPYVKGGICETGASLGPFVEAGLYAAFFSAMGAGGGGLRHKQAMKQGLIRSHIAGLSMVGEDMPQLVSRVDLDPDLRDVYGFPVPRITKSAHPFEIIASNFYGPRLQAVCAAAPGALASGWAPIAVLAESGPGNPLGAAAAGSAPTAHIMGTARMGEDPASSVTDAFGRLHQVDNLYVADGSVFVSAGGFNPSNTIMALALRMARHIVGASAVGQPVVTPASAALPNSAPSRVSPAGLGVTLGATGAAAAARLSGRQRRTIPGPEGVLEAAEHRKEEK